MASATELLRLVIDADGKGAITELHKVGAASEKELGKTDDKLKKVGASMSSIGASMAVGGAAVGVGLFAMAKMSEDAELQQKKLTNSIANSNQAFKDNGKALRDLAQDIQHKTGADGDAIVAAQSMLVQFGLTEDAVGRLSPLVTDLSLKMGVDLETAAKAIGKSVDGSAGALKKMGISVDETKFKVDPLNATIDALNQTVGGFGEEYGASFNGQLDIMKQNLSDIGENIGGGVVSVLTGITGAVGGLTGAMGEADPAVGNMVGKLLTIGALGATGLGGLSFVTGQFIQMRANLGPLTSKLRDAEGNLTRFGQAGRAVGFAGIAAGILYVADAAVHATRDVKQYQDILTADVAAGKGAAEIAATLGLAGKEAGGLIDDIARVNRALVFDVKGDAVGQVQEIDRALGDLYKARDTKNLQAGVDALKELATLPENKGNKDLQNVIDDYTKKLHDAEAAAKATDSAQGDLADQNDATAKSFLTTAEAVDTYTAKIRGMTDPLFGAVDAMDRLGESRDKVATLTGELAGLDPDTEEYRQKLIELNDAQQDGIKAARDQELAMVTLGGAVAEGTVPLDEAIVRVREWASQLGLSPAATDAFVAQLQDAVTRAQAVADAKGIEIPFYAKADGVWGFIKSWAEWKPEPKVLPVKVEGAWGIIQSWAGQTPVKTPASNDAAQAAVNPWLPQNAKGRASGGPVIAGQEYMVGERGPELWRAPANGTIIPNHQLPMQADQPLIGEYHVHGVESPQSPQQLASDARFVKALVR